MSGLSSSDERRLRGYLMAAKFGESIDFPNKTYKNLMKAVELLGEAGFYESSEPDRARARFVDSQRLFSSEESVCSSRSPAYCSSPTIQSFASEFRKKSGEILGSINSAYLPSGYREAPTSGPVTLGPALPPDQTVVQYGVKMAALTNQQRLTSGMSPQAQAARIRRSWSNARASIPAPAGPYPAPRGLPVQIPDARARQIILATQAQGPGLGMGASVAIFGLLAVSFLALGASVFSRRRTQ